MNDVIHGLLVCKNTQMQGILSLTSYCSSRVFHIHYMYFGDRNNYVMNKMLFFPLFKTESPVILSMLLDNICILCV